MFYYDNQLVCKLVLSDIALHQQEALASLRALMPATQIS